MSSKLEKYLDNRSRVSNEEFEEGQPELSPVEQEQAAIVEEEQLEIPEAAESVDEGEIIDAADEAEMAEEEVADLPEAVAEVAEIESEVGDEVMSIEEFTQVLRHGLKTNTFSPQLAAVAQQRIERLSRMFGEEKPSVSLENYGGDSLKDYYTVSLETFSGFTKRLHDLMFNATKSLADKMNTKWNHDNFIKKAKELNLRADAVLAGQAKAEPFVAKGKSVAHDFQIGGSFSGDPVAAITSDLRFVSQVGGKLIKSIDVYLNKVMDIIEDAVKNGGVGKTGDIVAKVLELTRPADELPEAAFTGAMCGGFVLTKAENKAKEGDRRGAYKDITRAAIPGVSGVKFKGDAADVTVDKAMADKLAKAAKALIAIGLKVVEANGMKSLQTFYRRIETQQRAVKSANATSWSENKDLNTIASKLLDMGQQQFNVYFVVLQTVFDNAQEAISLAEKAVGKAAAAPAAPAAAE